MTAAIDLFNDGSHPEVPESELIVAAGTPGEVVQIGHHEEANIPVYIVEFGATEARVGRVVGCLEEVGDALSVACRRWSSMVSPATSSASVTGPGELVRRRILRELRTAQPLSLRDPEGRTGGTRAGR